MGVPKDNVAAVDEKVDARVDDDEKVVDGDDVASPVRKVCKRGCYVQIMILCVSDRSNHGSGSLAYGYLFNKIGIYRRGTW